jgi:hypothetical protein
MVKKFIVVATGIGILLVFATNNEGAAVEKRTVTVEMGPVISIEYVPPEILAWEWGVDAPEE